MSLSGNLRRIAQELRDLPVTRPSQRDPEARKQAIQYMLAQTVYDWAAIDGILFPDGNPLNLDVSDPGARKAWQDLRDNQVVIIGDLLDSWSGQGDLELDQSGLKGSYTEFQLLQWDTPEADPMDVLGVLLREFPAHFTPHSVKAGEWKFHRSIKRPPALDMMTLSNVWAVVAHERNNAVIDYLERSIPTRFLPKQLDRLGIIVQIEGAAVVDWQRWCKNRRDYYVAARQQQLDADAQNKPTAKSSLTDFLQARLDKARLRFDASTARDQFEAMPMIGARAKSSKTNRTWGIELEIIDAGAIAFDAAGGWRRERDGSLRQQIGDGRTYDPWEFVSPILDSTFSDGLWMICDQAQNTVKYHKAGVHVHVAATTRKRKVFDPVTKRQRMVGGKRMTTQQVSRLIELYATISPLLDPIIARTKTREFCVPTKVDQWAEGWFEQPTSKKPHRVRPLRKRADDAIQNAKWWAQVTHGPNHDTEPTNWKRHQELNLQALNKYGTIEFRSMGAIYDYEYLTRWAWLCRAMVDFAQSSAPMGLVYKLSDFNSLVRLLNAYTDEPLNLSRKAA